MPPVHDGVSGLVAGIVLEVVSRSVQQVRLVAAERVLPSPPVPLAERWVLRAPQDQCRLVAETLEADEPIGKRLAFVVQELHREANTIGSKANDSEISHAVVSMKEEIERLREQVENVE